MNLHPFARFLSKWSISIVEVSPFNRALRRMAIKMFTDSRSIIKTVSEEQKTFSFGGLRGFCCWEGIGWLFGGLVACFEGVVWWWCWFWVCFFLRGLLYLFKLKGTACKVNLDPSQELQLLTVGYILIQLHIYFLISSNLRAHQVIIGWEE